MMKTRIFYYAVIGFAALLISCGSKQTVLTGNTAQRLVGLWEVKAEHRSDGKGYKQMPHGMFKMIMPDGKFVNFMTTEQGAIITVDGTYQVVGDSLYIEKIVHSFNKSQIGMDNPLNLKLTRDKFMYLRWFQAIDEFNERQNRWIEEIWQRVETEDLNKSKFALQQELRNILEDQEIINDIIE